MHEQEKKLSAFGSQRVSIADASRSECGGHLGLLGEGGSRCVQNKNPVSLGAVRKPACPDELCPWRQKSSRPVQHGGQRRREAGRRRHGRLLPPVPGSCKLLLARISRTLRVRCRPGEQAEQDTQCLSGVWSFLLHVLGHLVLHKWRPVSVSTPPASRLPPAGGTAVLIEAYGIWCPRAPLTPCPHGAQATGFLVSPALGFRCLFPPAGIVPRLPQYHPRSLLRPLLKQDFIIGSFCLKERSPSPHKPWHSQSH